MNVKGLFEQAANQFGVKVFADKTADGSAVYAIGSFNIRWILSEEQVKSEKSGSMQFGRISFWRLQVGFPVNLCADSEELWRLATEYAQEVVARASQSVQVGFIVPNGRNRITYVSSADWVQECGAAIAAFRMNHEGKVRLLHAA